METRVLTSGSLFSEGSHAARGALVVQVHFLVLISSLLIVAAPASANGDWSARENRNVAQVEKLFSPPEGFDPASLFREDAIWWNGLPYIAGNEGETEHKGIEAIRAILYGAGADQASRGVDSYDLTTTRYEDVLTLADGDYVLRQHTMHAKTHSGQDYTNVYGFVFRFDSDGQIAYLTEHWNTWHAWNVLFNHYGMEPAHPLPTSEAR
ncbi:MAG: nuclear transport factor 2 family protein [Myxococcota bacterium]|nr:nuclear transport factor 2 family protein [Myxococcota bacterium]